MDENRKRAIRQCHSDLRTGIIVLNFLPDLHKDAKGFLTDVEQARVESMSDDNVKQVDEVVKFLLTKENGHFDAFCTILERSGYTTCASMLKEKAGVWIWCGAHGEDS